MLNTMVALLWQYPRYWWNRVNFSSTRITLTNFNISQYVASSTRLSMIAYWSACHKSTRTIACVLSRSWYLSILASHISWVLSYIYNTIVPWPHSKIKSPSTMSLDSHHGLYIRWNGKCSIDKVGTIRKIIGDDGQLYKGFHLQFVEGDTSHHNSMQGSSDAIHRHWPQAMYLRS